MLNVEKVLDILNLRICWAGYTNFSPRENLISVLEDQIGQNYQEIVYLISTIKFDEDHFDYLFDVSITLEIEIVIIKNEFEPIYISPKSDINQMEKLKQIYLFFDDEKKQFQSIRLKHDFGSEATNFYIKSFNFEKENSSFESLGVEMSNFYSNFMNEMFKQKNMDFKFVEVKKDEYSLLRALSNQMFEDEKKFELLKDTLIDLIDCTKILYSHFICVDEFRNMNFIKIVLEKLKNGTLDCEILLQPFVDHLQLNVNVYSEFKLKTTFYPKSGFSGKYFTIYLNKNGFYSSLRPIDQ